MVDQRRSYTPEEKLKIVLEGLSGTIQISDLCRKYGIKSARYYYWKEELIHASQDIFSQKGRKSDTESRISEQLSEIQRLKDVIAEITQENLELKKKTGSYGVRR
jgi:transposase